MSNGLRDLFREFEQAPDRVGRRVQQALEAAVTAKLEDEQVETLKPGELLDIDPESGFRACRTREQLLFALCHIRTEEEFTEMRPYLLFSLHHPHWTVRRTAVFILLDFEDLLNDMLEKHTEAVMEDKTSPALRFFSLG